MVIYFVYFTSKHISVNPQVTATANQIDYWILGAVGDVNPLESRKLPNFAFYSQVYIKHLYLKCSW